MAIEMSVYVNAKKRPTIPRRHWTRQSRSSLAKVGMRPRSGGSTGFTNSGMAKLARPHDVRRDRAGGRPTIPDAPLYPLLSAGAGARERREAVAEARRRQRRHEGVAHLGDLAAAQSALALQERDPLRVETLPDEGELALARVEPRLVLRQLPLAVLGRGHAGGCLLLGLGTRARVERRGACVGLVRPRPEPAAFLLELDPDRGERLLLLVHGAVALFEPFPLGGRELLLRDRLGEPNLGGGQLGLELALLCGDARGLRLEHGAAGLELGGLRGELPLERLGRLLALERGPLARGERLRGGGLLGRGPLGAQLLEPPASAAPLALQAALQVLELPLPDRHRRGPFAELLLQLVELGPGLLLLGVPPPGELAGQPQQLVAVQVGPGVRRLARRLRGGRRPDVEALFPAVHPAIVSHAPDGAGRGLAEFASRARGLLRRGGRSTVRRDPGPLGRARGSRAGGRLPRRAGRRRSGAGARHRHGPDRPAARGAGRPRARDRPVGRDGRTPAREAGRRGTVRHDRRLRDDPCRR